MIVVRSQGQLGNQMFLLSAVFEAARPGERILAVGFVELGNLLDNAPPEVTWLKIPHRFDQHIKRLFKRLALLAMRGRTFQPSRLRTRVLQVFARRFRFLVFEFGLCQYGHIDPAPAIKALFIDNQQNSEARQRVMSLLRERNLIAGQYGFIHVRLKDYKNFDVRGHSPVLPAEWYQLMLGELRKELPGLTIVVLSDDINSATKKLGHFNERLIFLEIDSLESLYVMALSRAGILSASTFSWWGAKLASYSQTGPFIAPLFWMGFGSGEWFPSAEIRANFLKYVEVTIQGDELQLGQL